MDGVLSNILFLPTFVENMDLGDIQGKKFLQQHKIVLRVSEGKKKG